MVKAPTKHKSKKFETKKQELKYIDKPSTIEGAKKMLSILKDKHTCLLKAGTGGGKTFIAIKTAANLAPNAQLLIFTTKHQVESKAWDQSVAAFNKAQGSTLKCLATNYASLVDQQTNNKNAKSYIFNFHKIKLAIAKSKVPVIVILDETHSIKNPTSITGKRVNIIAHQPNVKKAMMLTATDVSNSLVDLENYLIIAGFFKYKSHFEKRYVKMFDDYHKPIVSDKFSKHIDFSYFNHVDELLKMYKSILVEVETDKLKPPVKFLNVNFKLNDDEQTEYNQIMRDYRNGRYENIQQAIGAQREFLAKHDSKRNEYVLKYVNSPKRPQTPILIFYTYQIEHDRLKAYLTENLPEYQIKSINGKSKFSLPNGVVPVDKTIILMQYKAGGEGLNCEWSSNTIFYTPTNSYQSYKQAQGRNVRAFQTGTVYQVRLSVEKTLNEKTWTNVIDNKEEFTKELKQRMLNE